MGHDHFSLPAERVIRSLNRIVEWRAKPESIRVDNGPEYISVGIFPNEGAVLRLIGALLLEQNDEWATQRARYMTLETIAPLSDTPTVSLPEMAA